MSPLFGKKKEEGKTVLVVDVESGSVGACLVRLSHDAKPKMFGEVRRTLSLKPTHDPEALSGNVLRAVEETLAHIAEVAARVRGAGSLSPVGEVKEAIIFFSPPWGAVSITSRDLGVHPFQRRVYEAVESFFGPVLLAHEPFGLMAAHTVPHILPSSDHYLLSTVSGEVTELLLLQNQGSHLNIAAHASLPFGHHYPLRTLLSHGGLSLAEARSTLRLYASGGRTSSALEALHAAGAYMANEFASTANELFEHIPAKSLFVVAGEPVGEWFARSLSESPAVGELFPEAGEVRALKAHQATPYVAVHARKPDLPLLIEALFVDARFKNEA